jgi:ferredoxin
MGSMTYVIAQPCIDNTDRSCVAVCPVDCVASDLAIGRKFYIDPDRCIDCGSRRWRAKPSAAPLARPEVAATRRLSRSRDRTAGVALMQFTGSAA